MRIHTKTNVRKYMTNAIKDMFEEKLPWEKDQYEKTQNSNYLNYIGRLEKVFGKKKGDKTLEEIFTNIKMDKLYPYNEELICSICGNHFHLYETFLKLYVYCDPCDNWLFIHPCCPHVDKVEEETFNDGD